MSTNYIKEISNQFCELIKQIYVESNYEEDVERLGAITKDQSDKIVKFYREANLFQDELTQIIKTQLEKNKSFIYDIRGDITDKETFLQIEHLSNACFNKGLCDIIGNNLNVIVNADDKKACVDIEGFEYGMFYRKTYAKLEDVEEDLQM